MTRSTKMRTPLKNVRRLGSAKEGADHFWTQRMTGVANLVLAVFLVWLLASLGGAGHAQVKSALASPLVSVPLLLLILSAMVHMRLGMQTIIEDYVSSEGPKLVCLMLNTFFTILVGVASVFAVLRLTFGA
ncbi:MAG: succinate dehydrogenase, hydrophobic membrane anchor protein [Hyphomicrobium sp.]|nr:MAG: succinate dehydrogenase, hydrophobic membrane anchor protein [Hyphomicrobium sp.]